MKEPKIQPAAWLCEYRYKGEDLTTVALHNRVKDYRAVDPNAKAIPLYAAVQQFPIPEDVREWILHMDLHLTEHDDRHAGLAFRAAWPAVRAHFLGQEDDT